MSNPRGYIVAPDKARQHLWGKAASLGYFTQRTSLPPDGMHCKALHPAQRTHEANPLTLLLECRLDMKAHNIWAYISMPHILKLFGA